MIGVKSIENVLKVTPAISEQMVNAIQEWRMMYENKASWLKQPTSDDPSCVKSLGLPQLIASEKARTALLEFESEITTPMEEKEIEQKETDLVQSTQNLNQNEGNPTTLASSQFHPKMTVKEQVPKGPTERATFLNETYKNKVLKKLRRELEYGIAEGGLVIKPYVVVSNTSTIENKAFKNDKSTNNTLENTSTNIKTKYKMEFDFVQADGFYPLAFNNSGDLTEAAFISRKIDKDKVYSRLEHHKLVDGGVEIVNMAFVNNINSAAKMSDIELGKQIPLSDVNEWKDLAEVARIDDVDRLMFAYFKMPEANTIDTYSPLGVSGFDKAKGLIEEADKQYSRLLWEFEGGELAIDIDRDALRDTAVVDRQGNTVIAQRMGTLQQRLYRPVDLGTEDTYNVFNPTLRDISIINGLNTILMRIEDVTGLSRGTISDASSAVERTATELKILKQRSYQTNADIQKALQYALDDLIYVMDVYCDIYKITPKGDYEVSYEWDDSILVDVEAELGKRMTLMQNGLASKIETRMWYFGETEKQAREALLKVQEENRLAVEENIATQFAIGGFNSFQQSPDKLREVDEE